MEFSKLLAYFDEWQGRPSITDHALCFDDLGAIGCYDGLRLHSMFQPILHAGSLHPFAYEALLRVKDLRGGSYSPQQLFDRSMKPEEIIYLDRLCRVVHTVNFVTQQADLDPDLALFLNLDGRHLLSVANGGHGLTFLKLLEHCGIRPQQIVLEIVESLVADSAHLTDALGHYQKLGYRIAIDDFGSRESNFDRLWILSPDIIKIDRSLVTQSAINPRARKVLPKLVQIIHELGANVVCEGIETAEQHVIADDAGADYLQGFHFAHPSAVLYNGHDFTSGDTAAPTPIHAPLRNRLQQLRA